MPLEHEVNKLRERVAVLEIKVMNITDIEQRLRKIEKDNWKAAGFISAIVVLSELVIKLLWK